MTLWMDSPPPNFIPHENEPIQCESELLNKISFEPAESFLKSKGEKVEDFEQIPVISEVYIEYIDVGIIKNPHHVNNYSYCVRSLIPKNIYIHNSGDNKYDEFGKMLFDNDLRHANAIEKGIHIIYWIANKLNYKYVTSLNIFRQINHGQTSCNDFTITATGLKQKTKTAPPPVLKLPSAQ